MKEEMLGFIKWFIMADAHTMDGDSVDFMLSAHESDMPEDQVSICKMEDRDNWGNHEVILDSSNVVNIEYTSVLENKKQIACAVVTVLCGHIDAEVKYTFRRLYYEDTLEACMEQILVLSTGHITQIDAFALDSAENLCGQGLIVYPYDEYGWIVVMPDDVEVTHSIIGDKLSKAFWDILRAVRFKYPNCTRIQLDRDGDIIDEFPQFDW